MKCLHNKNSQAIQGHPAVAAIAIRMFPELVVPQNHDQLSKSLGRHGHPGLGYWYPHLWKYSHFFTLFADQITMKSATQVAPLMRRLVHPEQLTEAGYEERFPKKSIAADCGSFWLCDKSIYIYRSVVQMIQSIIQSIIIPCFFLNHESVFVGSLRPRFH